MPDLNTDEQIKQILQSANTIALVGMSANTSRASHYVAKFLQERGHKIIPVNPGHAGKELLGEMTYSSLADIPKNIKIDMIDIFRRSEHIPPIVDEAIEHLQPNLKTVWMQLGIMNKEAASTARAVGISVIQDRCPKIEYPRLFG